MAQIQEVQRAAAKPSAPGGAGVRVRPVEPSDAPAVHRLLVASLPDVLADRDRWLARWRWQYWDNPYRQDRPAGFVLTDGSQVYGHLGAVYVPLCLGDARAAGVIGADYVVAPEAVALGGAFVALELVQKLVSACPGAVLMATTANEKTGAVFSRFGCKAVDWTRGFWRASTGLSQQVRTCCGGRSRLFRRALSGQVGRLTSPLAVAGFRAAGRLPAIPIARGWSLDTLAAACAPELAPLWERIRSERTTAGDAGSSNSAMAGLCVRCEPEYLDWRYARHPERDRISVQMLRDADRRPLAAAVLFADERADRTVTYLEEMICRASDRTSLRTLLCAALRLAAAGGAEYLVTAPGEFALRNVYWELGFEERARNAPAVVVGWPDASAGGACETRGFTTDRLEFWHGMMF